MGSYQKWEFSFGPFFNLVVHVIQNALLCPISISSSVALDYIQIIIVDSF